MADQRAEVTGLVAAVVGYLAGTLGPLVAGFVAITVMIEDACADDATECWAPLAYVLLFPIGILALVVIGPFGCVLALRARGHRLAGATGWRCVGLVVLYPAATFGLGLVGAVLPPMAVAGSGLLSMALVIAVPVVGRIWAVRAGGPTPDPAMPGETTWDAPWTAAAGSSGPAVLPPPPTAPPPTTPPPGVAGGPVDEPGWS